MGLCLSLSFNVASKCLKSCFPKTFSSLRHFGVIPAYVIGIDVIYIHNFLFKIFDKLNFCLKLHFI